MAGKSPGPFPNCDWRFNEFPNPAAHALHVTCVELMALAVPGKDVGNALLNVVLKRCRKQFELEDRSAKKCFGCDSVMTGCVCVRFCVTDDFLYLEANLWFPGKTSQRG